MDHNIYMETLNKQMFNDFRYMNQIQIVPTEKSTPRDKKKKLKMPKINQTMLNRKIEELK